MKLPKPIVQKYLMRQFILEHDEINVAIPIEVGNCQPARRCARAANIGGLARGLERPIEPVHQQLIRALIADEE